jgi:hypothetical protein
MEPASAGEYIALVVRLQAADDGSWQLHIDGTAKAQTITLAPTTLIIRLWKSGQRGAMRGTLQIAGDDLVAPFQCNSQLIELIRTSLFGGSSANVP